MKCIKCGSGLTKSVGDHVYHESGMDHVILRNVTKYECESCGAKSVDIPRMAQLHRLLAGLLVHKPTRLVPSEVRFLRDYLDLTNKGFAALMGVGESQASRWTSSKSGEIMSSAAENLLRMLTTLGPFVLTTEESATVEMVPTKPIAATLRAFPAKDAESREVPMRVRRGGTDWKVDAQASA